MKYGRVDVSGPEQCPEEGRLPGKLYIFHGVFRSNFYDILPTQTHIDHKCYTADVLILRETIATCQHLFLSAQISFLRHSARNFCTLDQLSLSSH